MLKHLLTTAFTLLALNDLHGQTFTAPGGSIPDGGPQVAFPVVVSGLSQTTLDQSFGLEAVCFNIEHTWDADLVIKLQAPDGTVVDLAYNVGGSGDDFTNTCLNPFASTSITSGNAPFNGTFRPIGPLGNMNNGQNGNGTWYLLVQDVVGSDDGDVIDFSLTFGNDPDTPYNFGSTNLPLVIINTGNNVIQDEPKVMARMGIIYNGIGAPNSPTDIWNAYDNWCGIEYRGATSGNFPQRSYGVETRDTFGAELTAPILALSPEEDWALIATYNDKALMRNALTYNLCNEMGYYAPRTRFCELILNDQYQGVYLLSEKIKRDQYRVNIADLEPQDISGDQVTGGYILKIDKFIGSNNGSWQSPHPPLDGNGTQDIVFQYEYPKAADLQPEQDDYIKGYIDSFENALLSPDFADTNIGYRHFADMNSFIDNFIINEVSRNVDGYRLSYYFYKDKASNGGKLRSGPAWDYNLAWWNADYCNGYADTGWAYRFGADCDWDNFQVPFWWGRMMEDTNFTNALKCRWEDLRGNILSNQHIFAYIDSNAAYLEQAQQRHFGQWPVMGIYTWPNPSPIGQTYAEEITHMKDWIAQRMIWLDAHMPGTCYPDPATTQSIALQNSIQVYPNPFMDNVKLDLDAQAGGDVLIEIYSSVGQLVYTNNYKYNAGKNTYRIQVGDQLASCVYFLKASSKDHSYSQRIIKQVK